MMRACSTIISCLLLGACATGQSYDGPRRSVDEVAHIIGDFRVTAGAPVTVILLKVDEYEVGIGENAVDVLPGKHRLLVECRVAETKSISRFTIEEEFGEGERYRLVAQTAPGMRSCSAVELEALQ